jgi:hypothetical protein
MDFDYHCSHIQQAFYQRFHADLDSRRKNAGKQSFFCPTTNNLQMLVLNCDDISMNKPPAHNKAYMSCAI